MRPSRSLSLLALCLLIACARRPTADADGMSVRGDSRTLTRNELTTATQLNLYDFIAAERPRWLQPQSATGVAVGVYLDGALLGGPTALRGVTVSTVTLARYYDTSEAQQKFSRRNLGPVIEVLTK